MRVLILVGAVFFVAAVVTTTVLRSRTIWGYPTRVVGGNGEERHYIVRGGGPLDELCSLLGLCPQPGARVVVIINEAGACEGWPRLTGRVERESDGRVIEEIELWR